LTDSFSIGGCTSKSRYVMLLDVTFLLLYYFRVPTPFF
jgi:hypothetical protein